MSPRYNRKSSSWSAVNFKKRHDFDELLTWACDMVTWYWSADTLFWQASVDHNFDVQVQSQGCMSLCQPVIWSMAAMLRDSVVVVVVHTRPRAIPLAMITMRKSTHGFPFVSHIWVASGRRSSAISVNVSCFFNFQVHVSFKERRAVLFYFYVSFRRLIKTI